jgi:hypothetical protein
MSWLYLELNIDELVIYELVIYELLIVRVEINDLINH